MFLFVGITVLTMVLLSFYRVTDTVQLHRTTNQKALNLWILTAVYLLLAGLSACRIASGNDYWNYTYSFDLIAQNRHVSSEPIFNAFVRLVQFFCGNGKGNYLVVFGVFSFATVFFFLKGIYDQAQWLPFSVFLLLTNGYYFSSFNSVRYYFALAIALYSIKYVLRGEFGKFLLWILPAAGFHMSILLVIPVYIIAYLIAKIKWTPKFLIWGSTLVVLFASSFLWGKGIYRKIIFTFYPYYEGSAFDNVEYSLTNIGRCLGTLALAVLCYKTGLVNKVKNKFYLLLSLGGLLLYTVGAFIPEVSRVAYYLVVPQIILIPNLLASVTNKKIKGMFSIFVALVFTAYFALFLKSAYSVDVRILPYLNWIFN